MMANHRLLATKVSTYIITSFHNMRMISPGFIHQLFHSEVCYVPRCVYCDLQLSVRCDVLFVLVHLEQSESIYLEQRLLHCLELRSRSDVVSRILMVDFDGG